MSKKALGKGLSALIPDSKKNITETSPSVERLPGKEVLDIPLEKISSNPFQPRKEFRDEKLEELVSSIREKGIIQPLVVRTKGEGYELIVGERRLLAAKRLQMKTVPAILRKSDDEESLEIAIIENIQRADLNPIEEAKAYEMLLNRHSLTQEAVGEKVGKSREAITNTLRLLKLPIEVQDFLKDDLISMGHARALLSLASLEQQRELSTRIVAQKLSVRETERLVALKLGEKPGQRKPRKKRDFSASPYVQSMAEKLQEKMGTKVTIRESSRPGIGTIEIEYYSQDDLDRIFGLLDR